MIKKSFRGFDLSNRQEKIENTINLKPVEYAEDFVVITHTPCYFAFGCPKPKDYYTDPAVMVRYQEDGYENHLKHVHDDTVPYFMPYFGTDVLASVFGCSYRMPEGPEDDPVAYGSCINEIEDIAKMKKPDLYSAGMAPKVIEIIDYAVQHSELSVGLTDLNSPLSTAAKMCGYENFFVWLYTDPEAIHDLMRIVTDTFIEWCRIQKKMIGEPLDQSSGLQGVWAPTGLGVWLSDDDCISISAEHYKKFMVDYYSGIFKVFGGGFIHFCGNGLHQADNILGITNIRGINNSAMYDFDTFGKIAKKTDGKAALYIQDIAPYDIEDNYRGIFNALEDLSGKLITTFVCDNTSMIKGGSVREPRDTFDVSNRIVDFVHQCVDRKLKGISI